MSKMFRFVLVAALAVALIVPLAGAQDKTVKTLYCTTDTTWYVYYATTDPGSNPLDQAPWNGPLPLAGNNIVVNPNQTIWFGLENQAVDTNKTKVWLYLDGNIVFNGLNDIDTLKGYGPDTPYHGSKLSKSPYGNQGVVFSGLIRPQPDWEVIVLKNKTSNAATITDVRQCFQCEPTIPDVTNIPSLTTYGIIILVLLLLASTVWVIRKKRAHVPA